jgi:hypothetical protein
MNQRPVCILGVKSGVLHVCERNRAKMERASSAFPTH